MDREADVELLLAEIFEKVITENYPEVQVKKTKETLQKRLIEKRYDVQDKAIIELILRDENKILESSFLDTIENRLMTQNLKENSTEFLKSKEGEDKLIETFILVLENLIDYFYNNLLNNKLFTT
ncbi:MAG: hypothetical protein KatS3mg078_0934 [Deltaproteobacteria bacterium]|jgi:uncharacterized protein (DUF2344 family)|nr:MAG: hypothetical protein KatS3mg078_0934 [Deltaproteobacteria bacterium]